MRHVQAWLTVLATMLLYGAPLAHAEIGIEPIPDQVIPSGKTLLVPVPASDPGGPPRSYTVTVGAPTTDGSATSVAGINAVVRTGDPHLMLAVDYTGSDGALDTGTMEFQLLREFAPLTTQIIGGLTQGGFYGPRNGPLGLTDLTFFRVLNGFVIQGGDPLNTGRGGPGFSFENEYSPALIFSGTSGQLAMANAGTGVNDAKNGTNGSQFFISLSNDSRATLDFRYTLFGQLLRGFDTLTGIAGTAVQDNGSGEVSSPIQPVKITSAGVTHNETDAVLVLSATGVCDATVTVTAASGTTMAMRTFAAHSEPDMVRDQPFLGPVPDTTAVDGTYHVVLQGTDLQRDLLDYGYQRDLPMADAQPTSGVLPGFSIPLVSNTDNTIAALLSHFDASKEDSDDGRIFHVAAGAKPLKGKLSAIPVGHNGALTLAPYAVAVFTAGDTRDTTANLQATLNWGDGTYLSGTQVEIAKDGAAGRFKIVGGHDYKGPGEYPVIVSLADLMGARLTLTGTATVSAGPIAVTMPALQCSLGKAKNGLVATFDDIGNPRGAAGSYAATIDWGDGIVTPGTIRHPGGSVYQVLGAHAYGAVSRFTVSTSVARGGGEPGYAWGQATVSGTDLHPVFPPFNQSHLAQVWRGLTTGTTVVEGAGDGSEPYANLIQGKDGNFYGTTLRGGGPADAGTVYVLTASGSYGMLHAFSGATDGAEPYAALMQADDGSFYGATAYGGSANKGTVFQMTTSGSVTTLHAFVVSNQDGQLPGGALTEGTDGALYGTTVGGGFYSDGCVYRITTSGSFSVIYSFTGGDDGATPSTALTLGTNGSFYGTTSGGGQESAGTIFEITEGGTLKTLHAFDYATEGSDPLAQLLRGADGNFYGTSSGGSAALGGTVFQMTPTGAFRVLHSFVPATDGETPFGGLAQGSGNTLYGTTSAAGSGSNGTIYAISTGGAFGPVFAMNEGARSDATLITGTDGTFYGVCRSGGANGRGTAFNFNTEGAQTTLHEFNSDLADEVVVSGSATILNSGNVESPPATLSVYAAPNGQLDGEQTQLKAAGQTSFSVPALEPGDEVTFSFVEGTGGDTRLALPAGFDPAGQTLEGVVTYSDPIGDFNGTQKMISLGTF